MSPLKTKRIFSPETDESSKRLVSDFVGNTPFVQLSDKIYAKLESVNPGGSIKDRPVTWIIDDAERNGLLKPNDTIIEATSGNTGIALAMIGAERGYNVKIVMPCDMSDERKVLLKMFGADLIEVDEGDFEKAINLKDEIAEQKGYFSLNQFNNLAIAINTGTNIPSVATPNGQAAFLFLLTSSLAPLINLSYLRMVYMALPYTIVLSIVGFISINLFL